MRTKESLRRQKLRLQASHVLQEQSTQPIRSESVYHEDYPEWPDCRADQAQIDLRAHHFGFDNAVFADNAPPQSLLESAMQEGQAKPPERADLARGVGDLQISSVSPTEWVRGAPMERSAYTADYVPLTGSGPDVEEQRAARDRLRASHIDAGQRDAPFVHRVTDAPAVTDPEALDQARAEARELRRELQASHISHDGWGLPGTQGEAISEAHAAYVPMPDCRRDRTANSGCGVDSSGVRGGSDMGVGSFQASVTRSDYIDWSRERPDQFGRREAAANLHHVPHHWEPGTGTGDFQTTAGATYYDFGDVRPRSPADIKMQRSAIGDGATGLGQSSSTPWLTQKQAAQLEVQEALSRTAEEDIRPPRVRPDYGTWTPSQQRASLYSRSSQDIGADAMADARRQPADLTIFSSHIEAGAPGQAGTWESTMHATQRAALAGGQPSKQAIDSGALQRSHMPFDDKPTPGTQYATDFVSWPTSQRNIEETRAMKRRLQESHCDPSTGGRLPETTYRSTYYEQEVHYSDSEGDA